MPAESSDIVELKLESREDGVDVRSLWDAGETGGKDGLIPWFGVDVMGIGKTAPVEMNENVIQCELATMVFYDGFGLLVTSALGLKPG